MAEQTIPMPCGCQILTGSHEFETSACPVHSGRRVADKPCPKCGHDEVRISYQEGGSYFASLHEMCKPSVQMLRGDRDTFIEHFHRTCQRCHYSWPTTDVLK